MFREATIIANINELFDAFGEPVFGWQRRGAT
jgi:hypothetical protein